MHSNKWKMNSSNHHEKKMWLYTFQLEFDVTTKHGHGNGLLLIIESKIPLLLFCGNKEQKFVAPEKNICI